MKNRKRIVVAFLLVAVMLLGVGYAAITSNLTVQGAASLTKGGAESELDEDVYFTNVVATNCVANIDAMDSDIVIVRITDTSSTMAFANDTASFVATVQNDSNAAATITPDFTTNEVDETFSFGTNQSSYTVAAGDSVEITVTITLLVNVPDDGITITDFSTFMTFDVEVDNE